MKNIFNGNDLITSKIREVLGYEQPENGRNYSYFTQDIYTQSFFYLTKRFGNCVIYDDYKDGGVWNFKVKGYTIQAYLNSSWLTFIVFGNKDWRMISSPYWTKYNREYLKKEELLIKLYREDGEAWSKNEKPIVEKLYSEFILANSINEAITTQDEWNEKYAIQWYKYLEDYNDKTIGLDYEEIISKHGAIYQNSYTRHALRTLEQFLKNMLVPIWIRDVPYNIKGVISDKEARSYSRYEDNIKILLDNDQ